MPVSWRISEAIVRLESSEPVTFAEWKAAVDAALASTGYRPDMGVLHDQRRLRDAPSTEEGKTRAAYVAALGIRRWAVLAGNDVQYGMARLADALSSGTSTEIRAFRDPAEAEAWAREGGE
jgi:hypothetical protein